VSRRRIALIAVAGVLAALASSAAPAAADVTVATVTRPTLLSAEGVRVVWSSFDSASGRYSLMTSSAGVISTVPVAPRGVPFDVDLGVDALGNTVATYSRCRREPPRRNPAIGNAIVQMPDWARGRGCDLYLFDFQTGKERRLAGASSRRGSEFLPSLSGDRIAFARSYPQRARSGGLHPRLYLRSITGRRGAQRLAGGPRSRLRFCTAKPRRCKRVVEPGPTALDLEGRRLAFAWDSGYSDGASSGVYLDTISGRRSFRRRLQFTSSGEIQGAELLTPAIDDGEVFWALTLFGDTTSNTINRFEMSTGRHQVAGLPGPASLDTYVRPVISSAAAAGTIYYVASGLRMAEPGCTVLAPCSDGPGCSDAAACQIRVAVGLQFSDRR
jgi:hypothetical protein